MRDELSGLSAFVAVAELGSFTAAAARLGVTPSAVSQAVAALEQRLGVRLLQRTTRSVGLTEAGASFVARVRPALAEVHAALEALSEQRERPAGTLRLTVPRVARALVVEPMLGEFLAAYPEIVLDLSLSDGLNDIVAEGFDAGVRLGETLDEQMVAVRISRDERSAVVAAPSYLRARGAPQHPRELHAHSCINYRLVTRGTMYRWEFTDGEEELELSVEGRVIVDDAALLLSAARQGLGLAYVLESAAAAELAAGRLVRVLEAFCPPFPGFFLYYPSRAHLAPKLRALVEFLKGRLEHSRRGR